MLTSTHEVTRDGTFTGDVFSAEYIKKRRLYITGEIDNILSAEVCAEINHLADRSHDDIWLAIIDSPGGSTTAGNAIIDTMNTCRCDICTVVLGQAASMAAVISSNGTKGKRYIGENARIMIHQASGGVTGHTADILLAADNIRKINNQLIEILSRNTGKPTEQIHADIVKDYYMNSEEAIDYGLVDKVFRGWEFTVR